MSRDLFAPRNVSGIEFPTRLWAASGCWGWGVEAIEGEFFPHGILGATVLKGTSLASERGAYGPRIWEYSSGGGVVNAIGLENRGVNWLCEEILEKKFADRPSPVPIFVNVFGFVPEDYAKVISRVVNSLKTLKITPTNLKFFAGFELNVSCPNVEKGGIEISADLDILSRVIRESVAAAEGFAVTLKLSATETSESLQTKWKVLETGGLWGIVLTNTLPVTVPQKQLLGRKSGGLSGAPLFLRNLKLVSEIFQLRLASQFASSIQIIACGGVQTHLEAGAYLEQGADFVQIGVGLWHPDLKNRFKID
jgi:dihydroorotate dehydrogenase (NAD+) catalytic subunit